MLVLAALLAGCGGSRPAPVIGTWSGALNQRGTVELTSLNRDHVRYVFHGGGVISRGLLSRQP